MKHPSLSIRRLCVAALSTIAAVALALVVPSAMAQDVPEDGFAYAKYDSSTTTLTFLRDGIRHPDRSRDNLDSNITWYVVDESDPYAGMPSWQWNEDVTKIVFENDIHPRSTYHWFANMRHVTSFEGAEHLDMSGVVDMRNMFFDVSNLTSLDVSTWDTGNVENMTNAFYGATKLTSLDVSNWDTHNVTSMASMFMSTFALTSLDVSAWDTSNVEDMSGMFQSTRSLTELKGIENWDTHSAENMSGMFYGANAITSLDGIGQWDTGNVLYMSNMFAETTSLQKLDIGSWDTSSVQDMSSMFWKATSLASLEGIGAWDTRKVEDMSDMFGAAESITNLAGIEAWDTGNVQNMNGIFYGMTSLTNLDGIGAWNTSKVIDLGCAFCGSTKLTELDLGDWDTSKVINMGGAFAGTESLHTLNLRNWSVKNIISPDEDPGDDEDNCNVVCADRSTYIEFGPALRKLTLGPQWVFTEADSIPTPSSDAPYTGKWARDSATSTTQLTADELHAAYPDEGYADGQVHTWVWGETLTYALTYDANGADVRNMPANEQSDPADPSVTPSMELQVSDTSPTRKNYEFKGWNTSADGSGMDYKAGASINLEASNPSVTLYAQWAEVTTGQPVPPTGNKTEQPAPPATDTAKPKPNKKARLARTGANTAALLTAAIVLLGSAGLVLMRKRDEE